jgi:hypothetical protein
MKTIVRAAMRLSSLTAEAKIVKAQSIIDTMQSSGNFPADSMPISYTSLQTLITNFQSAVVVSKSGTTIDTSAMHEKERLLVSAFNFVRAHVEMVANGSTDPETVILSADMSIIPSGGISSVSELTLVALGDGKIQFKIPKVANEKAYVFEISTDGTTWSEIISTTVTKTTISGQTPETKIYIRYYAINKTGKTSYSVVKNIIVL